MTDEFKYSDWIVGVLLVVAVVAMIVSVIGEILR